MKPMLTSKQLINHMKSKGIRFSITNEDKAKKFIESRNYYLKLASYRINYNKIKNGKKVGTYIDLEFAYLQDLARIDMELRYLVIQLCLDIEHAVKVKLLAEIDNNFDEDGYSIVDEFLKSRPYIREKIMLHRNSEYCRELIEKYQAAFPIWVFVELLSFSDMARFIAYCNAKWNKIIVNTKLLNSVRDIRNASAHSNCLINNLKKGDIKPLGEVRQYIVSITEIGAVTREKKLSNKFLYDFTTLLYMYKEIIEDEEVKVQQYKNLEILFNSSMLKNKEYYLKNDIITSSYNFLKKIIDVIICE